MNNDRRRKDPFNELMKPLDAFFNETPIKGFLQSIDDLFETSFPTFQPSFQVKTSETDSEYIVSAQLPGVNKEQIEIDLMDRYITITVQSQEEIIEEDENQKTFRKQQSLQRLIRTIPFPQPINEKQVKASYENGLLQITVPKIKGKQIYLD